MGTVNGFELTELADSGNSTVRRRRYLLKGDNLSSGEVFDHAADNLDTTFDSRLLKEIDYKILKDSDEQIWEVIATYDIGEAISVKPPTPGTFTFRFFTGIKQTRVKRSLETIAIHLATGVTAAKPTDGFINIQEDGRSEGVDIPEVTQGFSLSYTAAPGAMTAVNRTKIARATGKVNLSAFLGFAPGEVMFTGCQSEFTVGAEVNQTLEFTFEVQENQTGISIPGVAVAIDKDGYDYLWQLPEYTVDDTTKKKATKLQAVLVERVIPRFDLNELLIS